MNSKIIGLHFLKGYFIYYISSTMPCGILMGNNTKYFLKMNHTVLTLIPQSVPPHNTIAVKLTEEIKTFSCPVFSRLITFFFAYFKFYARINSLTTALWRPGILSAPVQEQCNKCSYV